MIKNEKQYKITKRKLQEVNAEIARINSDSTINPLRVQLLLAANLQAQKMFEDDLSLYESLKKTTKATLKERVIAELPSIITEYKIISGLTQKEFSEKLGLKEQQLQRYEADNFKSVTFKNLLRFLDAIGLEIRIKETRLNKQRNETPKKKKPTSK